jgi:hypothetical protein
MFKRTTITKERPGYPLPRVAQSDYNALRELMGDRLPADYDDWIDYINFRRRDEIQRHSVVDVDVHPEEFSRYVGTERNFAFGTLNEFLMQKIRGRRY